MLFKNANLFLGEAGFVSGSFHVESGKFTQIRQGNTDEAGTDLNGAYVLPGLVDIHTHGNSGSDFSDGSEDGLIRMARYLATRGVTSFLPTSMTLPYEDLSKAFATAKKLYAQTPKKRARVMGIHMEGPYLSREKKGAQNGTYLLNPDTEGFLKLQSESGNLIRIVDIAPELPGAEEFIREVSKTATVGLGHTICDYKAANKALDAGAAHLIHLFNAMPGLQNRNPGVISACSERENITAELICDGVHVDPSMLRVAFKLFPKRICLISDALRCCGMPEGTYALGGQDVVLKDGQVRLKSGNLAGSCTDLYTCMKNAIRFGIPKEEAILACTRRPATVIRKEKEIGSIAEGTLADFLVCDSDLNLKKVYLSGEPLNM